MGYGLLGRFRLFVKCLAVEDILQSCAFYVRSVLCWVLLSNQGLHIGDGFIVHDLTRGNNRN